MSEKVCAARRGKILLATDLSSRSDRALDRATLLSRQWDTDLIALHALQPDQISPLNARAQDAPSWRRPPDPAVTAEHRIRRDIREEGVRLSVVVTEGNPAKAIIEAVEREQCDLVVLGTARDETLGRMLLGDTVDHLVRRCPTSVLVVKARPNGPYRHIVVGTDFTEESRHGLEVAARAFPDAAFALMHAFELPYRSLAGDTNLAREFGAMEGATMKTFIEEANLAPQVRARIRPVIEHGPPDLMFRTYVEERGADLTVIGAFGRGLLFHVMIGGNAQRIVDATPSDVLVIRAPRL